MDDVVIGSGLTPVGKVEFPPVLQEVVIVSAVRTPIGKFQGSLSDFTAPQLGAQAVKEAVNRAHLDPHLVDECIMGNVIAAGLGQNPARQAAIHGGMPATSSALTSAGTPSTLPMPRTGGSRPSPGPAAFPW